METSDPTLAQLGWKSFSGDQLALEERNGVQPARVISVHRGRVTVAGEGYEDSIPSGLPAPGGPKDRPTVGDWLLVDRTSRTTVRILERTSLFKRPAPGMNAGSSSLLRISTRFSSSPLARRTSTSRGWNAI